MAFTIIRTPTRLSGTRSPIRLVVRDNSYVLNAGAASVWKITFTTNGIVGRTVNIRYGDVQVIMQVMTILDDSGYGFLPHASPSGTATTFYNGAILNYYLARDFVITKSAATVTFTARQKGASYNPASVVGTSGLTLTVATLTTGSDRTFRADHHVGYAVWVETEYGSHVYKRLPEQMARATDDDGTVSLDLHSLLRPYVEPDQTPYSQTTCLVSRNAAVRYYVTYWTHYTAASGNDRAVQSFGSSTDPYLALLAGYARVNYNRFIAWLLGVTGAPYRFLTYRRPAEQRTVTRAERHSLNWYNWYTRAVATPESHPEDLLLQARIQYTDGTTSDWSTRYSDPYTNLTTGSIGVWPVGWAVLGLNALADPDLVPAGYNVRIAAGNSGDPVSETFPFDLVDAEYQEVFIQFVNSLGAWESMRTTGAWQISTEGAYVEVQRPLDYLDDAITEVGSFSSVPVGTQRKLNVSSGHLDPQEHMALADILSSPAIRLVDATGVRFTPLRLVSSSTVPLQHRGTQDEHLYRLDLEFLADDPQQSVTELG